MKAPARETETSLNNDWRTEKPHLLQLHGMCFRTPLKLPEAPRFDCVKEENADSRTSPIELSVGPVPTRRGPMPLCRQRIQADPHESWLQFPRAGYFHIASGSRVRFQPLSDVDPNVLRNAVYGAVCLTLAYQRGDFPLHGTTVSKGARTLTFVGDNGAGKSTLALDFMAQGWRLVSDDLTILRSTNNRVLVAPGPARIKLAEPSDELGQRLGVDTTGLKRNERGKLELALPPAPLPSTLSLHQIIVVSQPTVEDGDQLPSLRQLSSIEALHEITEHVHGPRYARRVIGWPELLGRASKLLAHLRVYRLERVKNPMRRTAIADWLQQALSE